jgi:RHS repeat-associated protein
MNPILCYDGEPLDPVTGCYNLGNGYRVYHPDLRRFLVRDNLSPFDAGGINPYTYCAGDPINYVDPSGHMLMYGAEFGEDLYDSFFPYGLPNLKSRRSQLRSAPSPWSQEASTVDPPLATIGATANSAVSSGGNDEVAMIRPGPLVIRNVKRIGAEQGFHIFTYESKNPKGGLNLYFLAHGEAGRMESRLGEGINGDIVAALAGDVGVYKRVWTITCDSANGGKNSLGQQFSTAFGKEVVAFDGVVSLDLPRGHRGMPESEFDPNSMVKRYDKLMKTGLKRGTSVDQILFEFSFAYEGREATLNCVHPRLFKP